MLERANLLHPLEAFLSSPFSFDPLNPNTNPLIIIINDLSDVCKYTLIARFREGHRDLHFVITATSRLRRPTKVDGKGYLFVSKGSFLGWWSRRNAPVHPHSYDRYSGRRHAREEMKLLKNFDYVVVNAKRKLENAVKLMKSIIDAEKARVSHLDRGLRINKSLKSFLLLIS